MPHNPPLQAKRPSSHTLFALQVKVMQAELEALQPRLMQSTVETEELMGVIKVRGRGGGEAQREEGGWVRSLVARVGA